MYSRGVCCETALPWGARAADVLNLGPDGVVCIGSWRHAVRTAVWKHGARAVLPESRRICIPQVNQTLTRIWSAPLSACFNVSNVEQCIRRPKGGAASIAVVPKVPQYSNKTRKTRSVHSYSYSYSYLRRNSRSNNRCSGKSTPTMCRIHALAVCDRALPSQPAKEHDDGSTRWMGGVRRKVQGAGGRVQGVGCRCRV